VCRTLLKSSFTLRRESFEDKVNVARKVFGGGTLALDETAEVKEVDVINKSTKLSNREECGSSSSSTGLSFQSNNCVFHFEIITVKMMNKMFLNNVHLPILQSYNYKISCY
jgi:hypothetical protein